MPLPLLPSTPREPNKRLPLPKTGIQKNATCALRKKSLLQLTRNGEGDVNEEKDRQGRS